MDRGRPKKNVSVDKGDQKRSQLSKLSKTASQRRKDLAEKREREDSDDEDVGKLQIQLSDQEAEESKEEEVEDALQEPPLSPA
eukprot:gene2817-13599_t